MKINARIIRAIATKTKEIEQNGEMISKEIKKCKISVPKDGGGYEDIWPMITESTKNAELIVKGAKLNMYLSDDKKFVNAAFTWEPKEGAEDDSFDYGVNAGTEATA